MKKILIILLIFILFYGLSVNIVVANNQPRGITSASLKENINIDNRIEILRNFLGKYKSPLAPYADEFINAADYYDLDWKLVPSITGVESTFGKFIPFNSYNAYGWNNGDYAFESWKDSIWHVTSVLKNKYIQKGAISVNQIALIYAPPSLSWSKNVTFFISKLEQTAVLTFNL
jgi:hypothetical protein